MFRHKIFDLSYYITIIIIIIGDFMTRIYMVRHCEAIGNVSKLFQGTSDFDITEIGEKQLKYLKKRFDNENIDFVFSSPLTRTLKTAKAIVGDKPVTVEVNKGLIEIDGGILEGVPVVESFTNFPDLADAWFNHPEDFHAENGEAMRDVYERIWNTIIEIVKTNKGKTIACATHGGVIRCLMCKLIHNDIKMLKTVPFSTNTAVTLIEFDDDLNYNIVYDNDDSHLPEGLYNPASRLIISMKEVKE